MVMGGEHEKNTLWACMKVTQELITKHSCYLLKQYLKRMHVKACEGPAAAKAMCVAGGPG